MVELLNRYKMIQGGGQLKLGSDAVMLAAYVRPVKAPYICDLGCGTGAITLLLASRYADAKIVGVDIQEEAIQIANQNIILNSIQDRVEVTCADFRDECELLSAKSFTTVVCNPPYYTSSNTFNSEISAELARREVGTDIYDVCKTASRLLKNRGEFYLVYRSERLNDVFHAMRSAGVEPKRFKLIYNTVSARSKLCLVMGKKDSLPGLDAEAPLVMRDLFGNFSEDYRKIYSGGNI